MSTAIGAVLGAATEFHAGCGDGCWAGGTLEFFMSTWHWGDRVLFSRDEGTGGAGAGGAGGGVWTTGGMVRSGDPEICFKGIFITMQKNN